ncbi:uncharacterized protein LOC109835687 isoform X2 [Asparagus officinalis]|uniref:uncharacterized protein LOC109835687 isoform X2 n=1 Tax=Asparagus officinalis TaxID=4686 RepID=UPI00098E3EBC|nr:uncharacterized protein LOC109835687 isoform X2 [Asparagus officinalis]
MPPRPKTEPLSPSSSSPPAVRRNSPPTQFLETRVKSEPHHSDDDENHAHRVKSETQQEEEAEPETGRRGVKRLRTGPSGGASSFRGKHRRRLGKLLRRFMHEHRWNEAAGVVSVLIRGAPPGKLADDDELRRYYTVAMELHRRFINKEDRKYDQWIKQIYDMWMASFSRSYDDSRKKNAILMEFALFHFTQGNISEAYSNMQYVIQDDELSKDPLANLLHGMILYQLWYSGLPEEIRIKGFDNCMPMGTPGVASDNGYREMEIGESSNNYYAATTHVKFSSQCASESSFGNDKIIKGCNNYRSKTEPGHAHWPQEFYGSHSTAKNGQNSGSFNLDDNLQNSSIFFAHGLDTVLLPIHLEHFTGGTDQIIYQYRQLADGNYIDAVKHLRLALHSVRPLSAALFPLIQLLLLGDRVEEAFKELETSCHNVDSALPFRLMARLLECFQRNKITMICSYYENALKRDPICYLSLERLVKMHKSVH